MISYPCSRQIRAVIEGSEHTIVDIDQALSLVSGILYVVAFLLVIWCWQLVIRSWDASWWRSR